MTNFWAILPDYINRLRLFPRIFIGMYIYLLWRVTEWFMALPDPSTPQAGLVSVLVGTGAAWFGLYVQTGTKTGSIDVMQSQAGSSARMERLD